MLIELEGTNYNINADLILNCSVKNAATIASVFRNEISNQNGSRLILSIIGKKHHEFISFCRTSLSFGNKIIFILETSAQFRYFSHIRRILYEKDVEWCHVVQSRISGGHCAHGSETSDSIISGQFSK